MVSDLFKTSSPELMALTDPINLQTKILDNFEHKLNENNVSEYRQIVSDPHNCFNYLIEAFSTVSAEYTLAAHNELARQHVLRAQTSDDLYRHMSDFDYIGLFSNPCSFMFQLTLDKNHLKVNAKKYNPFYSKVIIPKNTIFKLGKYEFGIHYPIEIRLNYTTGTVTAVYNTEQDNPLQDLQTNVLEVYEHEFKSQNYVSVLIPVFQFSRSLLKEPAIAGHGFTKTVAYNNKYYGCRVYTTVNNQTIELHQTFTDAIYDPTTPTVRLYLEPERNKIKFNIPQIYFSNNQIGNYIQIELFTTHGTLDLDVTNLTDYKADVNFNLKDIGHTDIEFSRILLKNPHINLKPISTKLVGGSNGYGFEELRQRTKHNSFHTTVTVTPLDFEYKFKDEGFKVEKHLDNFTRRIYFAYKLLTDEKDSIIHTKHCDLLITPETHKTVSTILSNIDDSITILPTTLYEYDAQTDTCTPLTNTKVNYLKMLDKETLIEEMNSHTYTKTPFHIRVITDPKYLRASSYNMMNPTIDRFIFEKENQNTTLQMTTAGGRIEHLDEGTGGYTVSLLVKKSKDLIGINENNLLVYVYADSLDGIPIGIKANLVGTYQDQFIYEFKVNTDYWIDANDALSVTNLTHDQSIYSHSLKLQTKFNVLFLIKNAVAPGTVTDQSMYIGLPNNLHSQYICTVRQNFTVVFGENVDDTIYNNIWPHWQGKEYKVHEVDVPLTYDRDIYLTDSNGLAEFTIENGEVKMTILHAKGDLVYNENNELLYKHKIGDVIYGTDNLPVVMNDRIIAYYIGAVMLDAKLYASEHPVQIKYRSNITATLMNYIKFLRKESQHLLEQTELFLRPVNTLGNAKFHIGNGVEIIQSLASNYHLRCHVPKYVINDLELRQTIEDSLIPILEKAISGDTISLTEVAKFIKERMPEYIKSVDVLGINNNYDLQTMSIITTDSQPSVATKLHINKDGIVALKKSIDLEFVSE